jgi:hypothetical protein
MIGLFFELFAWMVKLTIIVCVLAIRAIVWLYHAIDQAVHAHRLSKDPNASREGSQLIAAGSVAAVLGALALIGSATGGGSSSGSSPGEPATAEAAVVTAHSASHTTKVSRHRAARQRAHERAVARQRARRRAANRAARARARAPRPVAHVSAASNCNPNYGGCLDANASDYDCEGGSGDGPEYTGPVEVKGTDVYDLDRDDDGIGCN